MNRHLPKVLLAFAGLLLILALINLDGGEDPHRGSGKESDPRAPAEGGSGSTIEGQDMPANHDQLMQIENLKGMLEKNPADSEHWIMLGNLYYDIGKFAQALGPYEKALLLAPANENVRVDYAVCLFNTGQDGKAIQELDKVVLANPNHQTATYNLGVIHLHAGNKDRARQYWNRTLQINATTDLASKARDALDRLK